jgi:hypothetical protein
MKTEDIINRMGKLEDGIPVASINDYDDWEGDYKMMPTYDELLFENARLLKKLKDYSEMITTWAVTTKVDIPWYTEFMEFVNSVILKETND